MSPATWRSIGSAIDTNAQDEEQPATSGRGGIDKIQFLTLPKLMTSKEIFVTARFVRSVTFMDVIQAMREINVLEETIKADEPRAALEAEAHRRLGKFAVGTLQFLFKEGVEVPDDLVAANKDALLKSGQRSGIRPVQLRKLDMWLCEAQGLPMMGAPGAEKMDRRHGV